MGNVDDDIGDTYINDDDGDDNDDDDDDDNDDDDDDGISSPFATTVEMVSLIRSSASYCLCATHTLWKVNANLSEVVMSLEHW